MNENKDKNDKYGKWSLYGTFVGIFILGIIYSISSEGIISTFTSFASFLLSLIAIMVSFFLILYLVHLISEKLVPITSLVFLVVLFHLTERSWSLTGLVVVLLSLFYLVDTKVKNKWLAKRIQIILVIIFFIGWSFHSR